MSELRVFNFNGAALTVYRFRGRECWIAQDVARLLGYDPKGWSTSWRRWVDTEEVLPKVDFAGLRGAELREFKRETSLTAETAVTERTPNLTILYESGLNLACIKTEKPLGRVLRRFLAEQVLPQLRQASENVAALRAEMLALNLRMTAGDNDTIWDVETVQGLCRLYRKPLYALGERMPAWLQAPMGLIYKTVLGDDVYQELKRRCPRPKKGDLNYEYLTEARHRLIQRDMQTVSAFLRVARSPDDFFANLRAAYRRAPLQLWLGGAR